MRILLFFPAVVAFICIVIFLYAASIIAFPVLGVMLFLCPHAPFIFGYNAYKKILHGKFKESFE